MTSHKMADVVACKALGEVDGKGTFEAVISVFGNVDLDGDRVHAKAFDNSIARWRESGKRIPIIWAHQRKDPFAFIGSADPNDLTATSRDLRMKGALDLSNPTAQQVYSLMQQGLIDNFSYTYEEKSARRTKDANELLELDLIEAGPCLVGANRETELLSIKSDELTIAATSDTTTNAFVIPTVKGVQDALADLEDKAGARHSAATLGELQSMHEEILRLGARLKSLMGQDDEAKTQEAPEKSATEGEPQATSDHAEEPQATAAPAPPDARELTAKAIEKELIHAERFQVKH